MIGPLATLILLSTLSLIQTAEDPRPISLKVVEVGDNITLRCPLSEKSVRFINWYKQSLGRMVQTVATGVYGKLKPVGQFADRRFRVEKVGDECVLTISDANKADQATYFCQSGTEFSQVFDVGFFLAVEDHNQQKCVFVEQSPEAASVQPGDSVTLQCSLVFEHEESRAQCPAEHRVYWFRAGSGPAHPGVLYRDTSDERSCVYSLSTTIRDASDAGTYYCAVVTCGRILFGDGTKVDTISGPELDPVNLVLGGLLVCCVTAMVILLFHVHQKKVCEHCRGAMTVRHHVGQDRSTADQPGDLDSEAQAENYAALTFSTRKPTRGEKRECQQESVYAAVRTGHTNQ